MQLSPWFYIGYGLAAGLLIERIATQFLELMRRRRARIAAQEEILRRLALIKAIVAEEVQREKALERGKQLIKEAQQKQPGS